jgi:hypothetical protein
VVSSEQLKVHPTRTRDAGELQRTAALHGLTDSNPLTFNGRVGSTPTFGTKVL